MVTVYTTMGTPSAPQSAKYPDVKKANCSKLGTELV